MNLSARAYHRVLKLARTIADLAGSERIQWLARCVARSGDALVTLRYLLDTNVISEPLRPVPNQEVLDHLREHQTEIAIASVVWNELWYGCYCLPLSTKRTMIEAYLRDVVARAIPILPYDQRAALWHAEERARLAQIGRPPPFADGQIAAVAAANDLCLITFNRDDYAAFQGLRLEDWRKS